MIRVGAIAGKLFFKKQENLKLTRVGILVSHKSYNNIVYSQFLSLKID